MTVKKLRMSIKSIQLYYDGDNFVDEGEQGRAPFNESKHLDNIVEATLEYPRSGAALVSTTKQMDLPSRTTVTPNLSDFWESGLFKETVDSETRFKLAVSDRDKRSRFGIWLRNILGVVLNTSVDPKVKAITNVFAGAVAGDLQTRLVNGVKGSQENHSVTALCASKGIHIELENNIVKAFSVDEAGTHQNALIADDTIMVELFSSQDFEKVVSHQTRVGSRIRRPVTEIEFEKGEKLGEALIKIEVIDIV